jgi:hypothetical protein
VKCVAVNWAAAPKGDKASAWRVVSYGASVHIETPGKVQLCRIGDGNIYLYDKKGKQEVAISVAMLTELLR